MDYDTPIKKNLWTNQIQSQADIQLFICHLMLDLKVPFLNENSFLDFVTSDNKPVFTHKGAAEYEKLMSIGHGINDFYYEYILDKLWPELGEWFTQEYVGSTKSIEVKSIFTGKVMYIAEFRSDFPLISVLYSVNSSNGNKKYKKIGYGTVTYFTKQFQTEESYAIYDNESKKYFEGILYKRVDGSFIINVASK